MGLDMYLTKKTFVWTDHENKRRELYSVSVPEKYSHIKPERIKNIEEEVGYWRKANQIHNWFVQNVQEGNDDCGEYYVSTEKLKELLEVCKKIKAESENPKLAEMLLPTKSGFFFGGTEYDEYYMEEIDDTIKIIEGVLAEAEGKGDYYYHSSW